MEELKRRIELALKEIGYFLYDLEYGKEADDYVLRVLIEGNQRITLDDCVKASGVIGELLDEKDPIDHAYNLEVTSAGAERELHTGAQMERNVGELVYLETIEQKLTGKLVAYNDGKLTIQTKNKKNKTVIDEMDIEFIRLALDF